MICKLEKVQKRAAMIVTRNYTYEKGSMTGINENPCRKEGRKVNTII